MTPAINHKPILPENPRPIVIIGAGGIVRDAHLPAYKKAGFRVFGIVDHVLEKAEKLSAQYDIPHVFSSAREAVEAAPENAVYDVALMPSAYLEVLEALPVGSPVLIQKPMGDNLAKAREIRDCCKLKKLKAAINFQLRYAPFVNAARSLLESGQLGELYDMEVRLTTYTPWEIFPNVATHERLEILYHSVHYIDLIRSFLGEPSGIMAKTLKHPTKSFSSTRSTILMDYGSTIRAVINTNHDHEFGPHNQESFIKWEGTRGAVKAGMGLLLNYPHGIPDKFEYCLLSAGGEPAWKTADLEGSWFPDAFIGTISSLMRYAEGSSQELPTGIDDAIHTMELVEAAYQSSAFKVSSFESPHPNAPGNNL